MRPGLSVVGSGSGLGMLGSLFGGSGPNAASIREANAQVGAMNSRIVALERRVEEQTELLERRGQEAAAHYRHMVARKDAEIARMR